jgi:hypothetical protein
MTPTTARDRATRLAVSDHEAALRAARSVGDPWFACQALASVARFAPHDQFDAIVDEAFQVGRRANDHYQIVGSAAWPLRALVERGRVERLAPILPELLCFAPRIETLASRSEALLLIYQAVFPAGRQWWLSVLQELARASHPAIHWRQARSVRDAVLMAASEDPEFARDFCRGVRNDRARAQIERGLSRSEYLSPRPFFWIGDA